MPFSSFSARWSALALVLAGTCSGCADVDAAAPEDTQTGAQVQTAVVAPVSPLQITEVTTRGTGCPGGSAQASVSSDGLAFTLTFSRYQIYLEPTDTVDSISLSCDVTVKFKSAAGLAFAVTEFAYQGYANLDPGVVASVRANYHFQGGRDAVLGSPNKVLRGPFDGEFLFTTPMGLWTWSDCGSIRDLVVNTAVVADNALRKRAGTINLLSIDAETRKQASIVFKLKRRSC